MTGFGPGVQSVVDVAVRRVRWLRRVMSLVILRRCMGVSLAWNGVHSGLKVVRSIALGGSKHDIRVARARLW
jgi:hypothetical protein